MNNNTIKSLSKIIGVRSVKQFATWMVALILYTIVTLLLVGILTKSGSKSDVSGGVTGVFTIMMGLLAAIFLWNVVTRSRVYLFLGTSRKDIAKSYLVSALIISGFIAVVAVVIALITRFLPTVFNRYYFEFYGIGYLENYFAAENLAMFISKNFLFSYCASFFALGIGYMLGNIHLTVPNNIKLFFLIGFVVLSSSGIISVPMGFIARGIIYLNSNDIWHVCFLILVGAICFLPAYLPTKQIKN